MNFDFIKRHRILKATLVLLVFSTVFIVNRGALVAARQHKDNATFAMNQEVVYVPDVVQLRLLTLGYDQAAADFVWLRTLSYFARHFTTDRKYPWLEHLLEQIIELDSGFTRVYHWAGANVLYGRRFTNENVFRSNHFYELALKNDPDDVEAAYRLGMNYSFELKGKTPEERTRFKKIGLSYLEMAANNPKSKYKLRSLVAGVAENAGECQIQLTYLTDMLDQTLNSDQQASLEARIRELAPTCGDGSAAMVQETQALNARWRAFLPYAPKTLFMQLGEPEADVLTDVDWRSLLSDVNVDIDPLDHEEGQSIE